MEEFRPRGTGLGCLACFICKHGRTWGGDTVPLSKLPHNGIGYSGAYQTDMACFVRNEESGKRVVQMFGDCGFHVFLDFRAYEPHWVQVKLGACEDHKEWLKCLADLTCCGHISQEKVNMLNERIIEKEKENGSK